jgi:hypothetical protein
VSQIYFLVRKFGTHYILSRFAEVEALVVLCMLVRNYRITIKEEPQYAGETFEQRYNRVFTIYNYITLTPHRLPITFTRR